MQAVSAADESILTIGAAMKPECYANRRITVKEMIANNFEISF